jgi:hypothetical protein
VLGNYFARCGCVLDVCCNIGGTAYVSFSCREEAERALILHKTELRGRLISVSLLPFLCFFKTTPLYYYKSIIIKNTGVSKEDQLSGVEFGACICVAAVPGSSGSGSGWRLSRPGVRGARSRPGIHGPGPTRSRPGIHTAGSVHEWRQAQGPPVQHAARPRGAASPPASAATAWTSGSAQPSPLRQLRGASASGRVSKYAQKAPQKYRNARVTKLDWTRLGYVYSFYLPCGLGASSYASTAQAGRTKTT